MAIWRIGHRQQVNKRGSPTYGFNVVLSGVSCPSLKGLPALLLDPRERERGGDRQMVKQKRGIVNGGSESPAIQKNKRNKERERG